MEWSSLLSALVGGMIAIGSNVAIKWWERSAERQNVGSAFQGEISAIVGLIQIQRYQPILEQNLTDARQSAAAGGGPVDALNVNIEREYFGVYKANLSKFGMLAKPLPEKIVGFYMMASAIMEDLKRIHGGDPPWSTVQEQITALTHELTLVNALVLSGSEICATLNSPRRWWWPVAGTVRNDAMP